MKVEVDELKMILSLMISSSCWYNFFFMSKFSGTHSWRKKAPETASLMSVLPEILDFKTVNMYWKVSVYRKCNWTVHQPTTFHAEVRPVPKFSAVLSPVSTHSRPAMRRYHKLTPCSQPMRKSLPMIARSNRWVKRNNLYIFYEINSFLLRDILDRSIWTIAQTLATPKSFSLSTFSWTDKP